MAEDLSILIRELLPVIFALVLVKYKRNYGIFAFLFLIIRSYFDLPVWFNIVFWSLTAVLACAEHDTMPSQMIHNINYDVSNITTEAHTIKSVKEAFKKFDNISK